MSKKKCPGKVKGGTACENRPQYLASDEEWYCGYHNPDAIRKRREMRELYKKQKKYATDR